MSRFDLWPYLERFTIDATKGKEGGISTGLGAGLGAGRGATPASAMCTTCLYGVVPHRFCCTPAHCTCLPLLRTSIADCLPSLAPVTRTEILAEMGGKPDFIIGNYRCAGKG